MYNPGSWKKHSLRGIDSKSPKWKIQAEVCRAFDKIPVDVYNEYMKFESSVTEEASKLYDCIKASKIEIDSVKRALIRKRNPLTESERLEYENKLLTMTTQRESNQRSLKKLVRSDKNTLSKLSNDIHSRTGISSDVADSICIAYCLHRNLLQVGEI